MVLSKKQIGLLVKEARKAKSKSINKKYTQNMLAADIQKSQGYIGDIEAGRTYPSLAVLSDISQACGVPFSMFGEDLSKMNDIFNKDVYTKGISMFTFYDLDQAAEVYQNMDIKEESSNYDSSIKSSELIQVPILGIIRAGEPILAQQNIIGFEYLPEDMTNGGEFFGLKVNGDSMNNSRINDGDVVLVRQQEEVENGEIAVILVDGENATIKRFYKTDTMVTLVPDSTNKDYQPRFIDTSKESVKVLGKVVKVIINI